MSEQTVEFSGTIQNSGPQKITGTGKIVSPEAGPQKVSITSINVVQITFAITITLSITLAFTFEFLFEGRTPSSSKEQELPKLVDTTVSVLLDESLSARLREFGIDGYIVIVDIFDNVVDAEYFESVLRQKRVHEKSLFFQSKYYVYVGPLYGKRRASSVLHKIRQLGYSEAYLLYPN